MASAASASHVGEHHEDFGSTPITLTRATKLYAICASVNSCNLGYDIGVSTETGRMVQAYFNLTTTQRELFIGSINFWAIFGALGSQYFTDRFGRRRTFIVAAIGFIIGVLIQTFAPSFTILMLGRVFVGLGVGIGLAIDPLYIAEVTPAKRRGELVTWSEIGINIGIILGFSTGLTFASVPESRAWRYMFFLGTLMPVMMILLTHFILPESPRYLVAKGRESDARDVLTKIYPQGYDVYPVIDDIKEAIEREEMAEQAVGWSVFLNPTPALTRMLIVGIGVACSQQAVGIDAIQYYLVDVLAQSGIQDTKNQNLLLMLLGLIKVIFIAIGGKLFDIKGRRPLFFVSLIGMSVALFIISMAFFAGNGISPAFAVIGLGFYLAFFSVGAGPGSWLIPSEVFAISIRAKAMSLAAFFNRITATIMASTFLSTAEGIGWGGFFLLLSIVSLLVCAFVYKFMPETKDRSLEDMSMYFAEITADRSILEAEKLIVQRRKQRSITLPPEADPLVNDEQSGGFELPNAELT
ncbi:protein O-mannosyltransferase 2 [Mayamaea pseudoterrestris]|nr:protein O-mannosyltransferase 2 [Mayamaea pseudoterrestris]